MIRSDAEAALALATKLAFADDEPSKVRVLCLNQLAEDAEKAGQIDPAIERTYDPLAELAWIRDNLDEVGDKRLYPSKNRFGVKTKRELAVEMAKLLNVDFDLTQT